MIFKNHRRFCALLCALLLTLVCLPTAAAEQELSGKTVILHVNDFHSRVDDNLGYATLKTLKDEYEAAGATVLVLDAGDTFHGLPIANLSTGLDIVDIMNAAGFTAMTPGNHDFNYGVERLLDLSKGCAFDLLSCNLTDANDELLFPAYALYNNVAVVGVTTPETATKADPRLVEDCNFHGDALAERVQAAVDAAKGEGAEYVVVLGHLGVDPASEPYRSTDVIAQVQDVDVWVDGHSHTLLGTVGETDSDGSVLSYSAAGETVADKTGADVLLVQTGCYGAAIGAVVLDGDKTEATLFATGDKDAAVSALIAQKKQDIQPLLDRVVAHTEVALDGERERVRAMETNLGDLAADALRYVTDAEIGFTNGGGIRVSLEPGEITYGDLNAVFPFGNVVKKLEVSGATLQKALEHGTAQTPELSGRFPQLSGVSYALDATRDTDRLSDIQVNGEPLDPERTYTLATNDFTAAGGDGYDMFASCLVVAEYGALDEALISYIADGLKGSVSAEYQAPRGSARITFPAAAQAEDGTAQAPAPNRVDSGSQSTGWALCLLLASLCLLLYRRARA